MKLKTFTALITVAVQDHEEMPHEFAISERIRNVLEGTKPADYPSVQACHASVVQGDVMMDPFLSLRTTEKGGLMQLNALGHTLQMVKDQHELLHSRLHEEPKIPPPTQNEGSDID